MYGHKAIEEIEPRSKCLVISFGVTSNSTLHGAKETNTLYLSNVSFLTFL